MAIGTSAVTFVLFLVGLIVVVQAIRVVPQQRAWVVERLGRFCAVLQPGLNFVIPFVDRIAYRHDLREIPMDVPSQIRIASNTLIVPTNVADVAGLIATAMAVVKGERAAGQRM